MKEKRAIDLMKQQSAIEMPWNVAKLFTEHSRSIEVSADLASIGEDYVNLQEMRQAIGWLVDQFGGEVEWKDED